MLRRSMHTLGCTLCENNKPIFNTNTSGHSDYYTLTKNIMHQEGAGNWIKLCANGIIYGSDCNIRVKE